jgi:hypothetical protein
VATKRRAPSRTVIANGCCRRFPAGDLVGLYHERWEIECAYLGLKHTLLHGHVLRSGDRSGLEQEMWALLILYQLLRMAIVTAVETCPGVNPDRASFTTAREAARDELVAARGVQPAGAIDLLGAIGPAVLATCCLHVGYVSAPGGGMPAVGCEWRCGCRPLEFAVVASIAGDGGGAATLVRETAIGPRSGRFVLSLELPGRRDVVRES